MQRLKDTWKNLFQWFTDNIMTANAGKCHFICSSSQKANLTIENEEIANNIYVKLLDVKIDSRLTHKKAGQKLNALERITPYLND